MFRITSYNVCYTKLLRIELFLKEIQLPLNLIRNYLRVPTKKHNAEFIKLLTLSGAFKQCDHLSSGMVKHLETLEAKDFDFLYSTKYDFYTHQIQSSQTIDNVILTAPTGSGKTETSFLWLKNQIENFGQGRVFYILPVITSYSIHYTKLYE